MVWPSQYDAEASSAPTVAGATTTIDAEPGQPSEPRQAWTLGGTGLGDTQGSPQDLAASVDLSVPSSPDMPVSDQTDVADPPHFRVAWQAPAPPPEQPEEQAVVVWPSRLRRGDVIGPDGRRHDNDDRCRRSRGATTNR